jgi:hypothetical protein
MRIRMSKPKVECSTELKNHDLEAYMREVAHVTEDMKHFVHKMRKIKRSLLGPQQKPNLGRS